MTAASPGLVAALRVPGPAGRWAVAAAAAVWIGALAGIHAGAAVALVPGAAALVGWDSRRSAAAGLAALVCAGALSGSAAAARADATMTAPVPEGPIIVTGLVAEDGSDQRPGVIRPEALGADPESVAWSGPALAVDLEPGMALVAGDRVRIEGIARARPGTVRGDPVAGRIRATGLERIGPRRGPLFAVGNAIRRRVATVISSGSPADALLTGFLIGDTADLAPSDIDALRRSGLTHYVAVSGSNVALFLAGWWLITAPLGRGSRRRFALGLIGLAVFVVATRWEASVIRAATMAGLALGGAAAGLVIDGWMALGGAVALLLLTSGGLALDVGFQLSVAATAGIMVGAGVARERTPRWAWTALIAAVAAQISVVPVLLLHFGTIPLLAPVANLMAAPLVSLSTITGAFAVLTGWPPLVIVASSLAGLVLGIARLASEWPQLGPGAVLIVAVAGSAAIKRRWRPVVAVAFAGWLASIILWPLIGAGGTSVTVLDVGQGDAVLLRSEGRVALVDGGSDPIVLSDRLRDHGVDRIDLLVVTHGDTDHAGGLAGILATNGVGRIWIPSHAELSGPLVGLVDAAIAAGVTVDRIDVRSPPYRLGAIRIQPLGPQRRYAGDNDGSIVLWVEAGRSMMLAGDAEAVAQRELPQRSPDILLVPHHGSATTDATWLAETVGATAVISVGPNRFGHPAPEIRLILEQAGARVFVTAEHGDVSLDL